MPKSKCKHYSYDDIDMCQYTRGACIGFKNCRIYEVETKYPCCDTSHKKGKKCPIHKKEILISGC